MRFPINEKTSCAPQGFSLIEVVVAMGVLSIAVLSSIALLGRSADMQSDVVFDTYAPMVVDAVVDELRMVVGSEASEGFPASNDRRMTRSALPLAVPSLETAAAERLVLLFSSEGAPLGVVDEEVWVEGSDINGGAVLMLCEGEADDEKPSLIRAEVTLTFPAAAPLESRKRKRYAFLIANWDR